MPRPEKTETSQRRLPRQARSRATYSAILEGAARILRREGEAALTTNRTAEVAGVGIGTLYGYFPDKHAIVVALAEQILEADEQAIAEALAQPASEPLRAVIRALIARHLTDRALRRIVLRWHIGLGLGASHAQRADQMIAQVVAMVYPPGAPRPDPATLFTAAHAVLGVCRALTESEAPPEAAEIEARLLDLLRHALRPAGL